MEAGYTRISTASGSVICVSPRERHNIPPSHLVWFLSNVVMLWVVLDDGDWRNILQQERVKWYVYPPRSRVPYCVKLTSPSSLEVSENRVNLRNFLVDSLTLFPLKPPFLLFLCRGWDRILSIASVYCIPTRDTHRSSDMCRDTHITTRHITVTLWHRDMRAGLEKPCIFGGKRTWHNMTFYI